VSSRPLKAATNETATAYIVSSDCLNCGVCEFMCPEGAIVQAPNQFIIDRHRCTGCGKCVPYCLIRAITPRDLFAQRQERTVKARLRRALADA
jgi:Fe-S-cluster-containing hydrogenase component 2